MKKKILIILSIFLLTSISAISLQPTTASVQANWGELEVGQTYVYKIWNFEYMGIPIYDMNMYPSDTRVCIPTSEGDLWKYTITSITVDTVSGNFENQDGDSCAFSVSDDRLLTQAFAPFFSITDDFSLWEYDSCTVNYYGTMVCIFETYPSWYWHWDGIADPVTGEGGYTDYYEDQDDNPWEGWDPCPCDGYDGTTTTDWPYARYMSIAEPSIIPAGCCYNYLEIELEEIIEGDGDGDDGTTTTPEDDGTTTPETTPANGDGDGDSDGETESGLAGALINLLDTEVIPGTGIPLWLIILAFLLGALAMWIYKNKRLPSVKVGKHSRKKKFWRKLEKIWR